MVLQQLAQSRQSVFAHASSLASSVIKTNLSNWFFFHPGKKISESFLVSGDEVSEGPEINGRLGHGIV